MQMTIHLIANSHYVGIFINTIQFQVFDLKVLLTHLSSYKVLKKVDLPVKIQASPFFLPFFSIILHSCNFLESLESKLHLHHHFHNYIHQ